MKKLIRLTIVFVYTTVYLMTSGGPAWGASKASLNGSETSFRYLAARAGVEPEALEEYFASLARALKGSGVEAASANAGFCLNEFADSTPVRTRVLRCLTPLGLSALDESFFARLFELRKERVTHDRDFESNRSLGLIAYLEDLTRENLHRLGRPAGWYIAGRGFLKSDEQMAFPFEDGDIVLGLGNSSLSSLITQVTDPQGRYSHAFLVRVRDGRLTTLEALVETGVREFSRDHFKNDLYNHLTVLRWKDPVTRETTARRASDIAREFARRRVPYDSSIDLDNDQKMFCTEVIVRAYADATGLNASELLPHFAHVRSEEAFDYVKNLGVSNRDFVSPGDLFASRHLETVADYRRVSDLYRAWKLYLMGDVFLERIERGYTVKPGPLYALVPIVVWVAQLLPSLFIEDARLIPKSMGPGSLAIMASAEKKIYKPALAHADRKAGGRSLLQTSLWDYRGRLNEHLDEDFTARSVLVRKENAGY